MVLKSIRFSGLAATLLFLFSLPLSAEAGEAPASDQPGRAQLSSTFLLGQKDLSAPVPTTAYFPPADSGKTLNRFEGRLSLIQPIKKGHARRVKDDGRLKKRTLKIGQLPPLDAAFVQSGNDIIPLLRGPQASSHPYWEWILEPGKVWDEPDDQGYSRVSMPFSLQERNQNCTHHGMLSFLFRSDGSVSRMAYQVLSETCLWLMADLWGVLEVSYTPGEVPAADAVIERYREEMAHRLPVKLIESLTKDYPGVNPAHLVPKSPEYATIWGVITNGTHYIGGCQTRYGTYPFCQLLDLPSYSTAKSVFAGLALMYLERLYPGVSNEQVSDWIPECVLKDERWKDVRLQDLVNMTSGLYNSKSYMKDEGAITQSDFIQGDTHQLKVKFACRHYKRHREAGQYWVYHTSDSYLAGLMMNRFLRKKSGADKDIFNDLLSAGILQKLHLSPVTESTRRTYDELQQPYTGYGLTYHPDDIARIARWLNEDEGKLDGTEVLDPLLFNAAMQRSEHRSIDPLAAMQLDYRYGFWAANAGPWVGCAREVWVPFMSGFGGITVALLPNDTVYYYFSDSNIFNWAAAVGELHKIRSLCAH